MYQFTFREKDKAIVTYQRLRMRLTGRPDVGQIKRNGSAIIVPDSYAEELEQMLNPTGIRYTRTHLRS